jgi:hypothetical protein
MKTSILKVSLVALITLFAATTSKAFTATTSGNWSNAASWGGTAPGASVTNSDIIIPAGITITLDMDVTFAAAIDSFKVNGVLTNSTTYGVTMTQGSFAGSGSVSINNLSFATLGTCSFTGILTLHRLTNTGAALLLASVANVTDTLDLSAGSMLLNAGANLTMQSNSTVKVNAGTITINGGVFGLSNNYNVLYVGSAKTTGIELSTSTLQNVYVRMNSNTEVVTLGSNMTINNTLFLTTGQLDFSGKKLTLKGDLNSTTGTLFTSNATSNLSIQGTASLTGAFAFSAASSIDTMTVNLTGISLVKLMTALSVAGKLNLMNGTLRVETGGALTFAAGSMVQVQSGMLLLNGGTFMGTASYNAAYTGGSMTAGTELSGSGLHSLTINLTSTVASITLMNNLTIPGVMSMTMGNLRLSGYILNLTGTLSSTANAAFAGTAASEIDLNMTSSANDTIWFSPAGQQLSKLKMNLGAAGTVALGSGLTIGTELNLTNGKLEVTGSDLIMLAPSVLSAYSNSNYVVTSGNGRLQLFVNSNNPYVTFPIGTAASYSPGYIQQTSSGTSGFFMMHVMDGVLTNGTTGFNSATIASVVNKTWLIDADNGVTVNLNMKLGWEAAAEVNAFNRNVAHISHYHSATWDTYADAAAASGVNSTFELNRTGITSLSPFAVTDNLAAMGVPTLSVNSVYRVYPNPASETVTVEILPSGAIYLYEVLDASGRVLITTSNNNGLNSFSISNLPSASYFMRITDEAGKNSVTKAFIKN